MDAILADTTPCHDDTIAGQGFFDMAGLPMQLKWHQGSGTTVDQRLAGKTVIKDNGTVDGRDTAFVASMLDPFNNPFKDTAEKG